MKKVLTLAVVLAISMVGMFGSAWAADQVHTSFDLPAMLSASIQATACSGSPGPQVAVQGDLTLTGLNTQVIFRNVAEPKASQVPIAVEQIVVPAGQHVGTPAQSIVGGLGDNPYLWLQIADAKGRPLTSEMFLGRCDQGTFTTTANLAVPATADAAVTATDCGTSPGPAVTLDGATEISPLTAKVIFRNSIETSPSGKIDQSVSEMVFLPAGQSYPFPAQPVLANTGTNPLVSLQFRLEDGTTIGTEIHLGRCSSFAL